MIYIFKGVQSICSLPGLACKACGELCAQCNCNWIRDGCNACGNAVTHFFERPLSTYVLISLALSSLSIYSSYLAMEETDPKRCNFQGPVEGSMWSLLQLVVGVINMVFAIYFQRQVWLKIMELVRDDPSATTDPVLPPGPSRSDRAKAMLSGGQESDEAPALPADCIEKVVIKKDTVQQAFKSVFLEDFGVLGFFILLCVNFGLASMATVSTACDGIVAPYSIHMPRFMFGVCAFYTICYYCCTCCANKVEIEKEEAFTGSPVE